MYSLCDYSSGQEAGQSQRDLIHVIDVIDLIDVYCDCQVLRYMASAAMNLAGIWESSPKKVSAIFFRVKKYKSNFRCKE